MASSGLRGPFRLDSSAISGEITRTSAGAYALGRMDGNTFLISYVGRADSDVAKRLSQHVGEYAVFKYEYYASPKAAFEKECELYHMFGGEDNQIHPRRPDNAGWLCPRCRTFG